MIGEEKLRTRWKALCKKLSNQFANGAPLDVDVIIYLIGVQELGVFDRKFAKEEKIDLMHVAVCRLLEPLGYYSFDYYDDEGWPHFKSEAPLPSLKPGEQTIMLKEAIVHYFLEHHYIS